MANSLHGVVTFAAHLSERSGLFIYDQLGTFCLVDNQTRLFVSVTLSRRMHALHRNLCFTLTSFTTLAGRLLLYQNSCSFLFSFFLSNLTPSKYPRSPITHTPSESTMASSGGEDRLVIGFDFGTTYSGVAFTYSGNPEPADEIAVVKK